jgi:hypothetical protein
MAKGYQGKEIHVILDNLSTHKPKRDMWLARHLSVHFHYTPTHASLTKDRDLVLYPARSIPQGASFNSVAGLIEHIASSPATTEV